MVNVISEWAGRAFCVVAFVVSFIYIERSMVLLKKIVEGGELLCNNIITLRVCDKGAGEFKE